MEQGIFVAPGKARLSRLAAWLGLTLALVLTSAGPVPAQMTTSGAFDVDHSGVASFSIPVQVVPGTGGMVPALTLNYSSQAGNGPLGVGWSLDGISVITRCSRTMVQDGARGGVNYDANDRFCMDGQRLMVQDGGAYGAAGSTYRTELDSFSKVTAVGQAGPAGAGPASFTVRTKSGLILEYGNTTDSKVLASADGPVRVWAVSRITDTVGNYMAFTYESPVAGEHRPLRIDYTGNAVTGLAPYASVRFVYAARTDKIVAYDRGLKTEINNRMTNIRVYYGSSTVVTDYQLTYDYSPATKASRIVKVEQCTGSGSGKVCLPPVNLTWSGTAPSALQLVGTKTGFNTASPNDSMLRMGDFDGNGLVDFIKYVPGASIISTNINLGNFNFSSGISTATSASGSMYNSDLHIIDVNMDGYDDVIIYQIDTGKIRVFLSKKDGSFNSYLESNFVVAPINNPYVYQWATPVVAPAYFFDMKDYNYDGKLDVSIIVPGHCQGVYSAGGSWVAYGDGSGNFSSPQSLGINICNAAVNYAGLSGPSYTLALLTDLEVGDFDFDGDIDYQFFFKSGSQVNQKNNEQPRVDSYCSFYYDSGSGPWSFNFSQFMVPRDLGYTCNNVSEFNYRDRFFGGHIDFNGDGLSDYFDFLKSYPGYQASVPYGSLKIGYGKGAGLFDEKDAYADIGIPADYRWFSVADMNGDGRPDIRAISSSGQLNEYTSQRDGSFLMSTQNIGSPGETFSHWLEHVDLNGDGTAEMFLYEASSGSVKIWRQQGTVPDRVTAFTDGLGSSVTVTYASLTDPGVYEKGTSAVAGQYSILAPVPVVREIATSDGIGGLRRTRYTYGDLRVEPLGRGQLGFGWVREIQLETDVETLTEYSHSWPFTGIVTRKWLKVPPSPGQAREDKQQLSNGYGCLSVPASPQAGTCTVAPGKIYFPYVRTMVEDTWDLDGTVMPRVTTETAYDGFGNATEITVDTGDGFSKTTVNTYDNDTTNWLIGRLRTTTVTATAPALP